MKRTILFFLLVAFAGSLTVYAQKKEAPKRQGWDSVEFGSLYGNVESVTITEYYLVDKSGRRVVDGADSRCVCKFNSKGDVVECICRDGDGSLHYKTLYKYDSQGNMIEEVRCNDPDSQYGSYPVAFYKYDAQGNMIEAISLWPDYDFPKIIYRYDSQGNCVEEVKYYNRDATKPDCIVLYKIVYRK